jgi:hypothetical protein
MCQLDCHGGSLKRLRISEATYSALSLGMEYSVGSGVAEPACFRWRR